MSEFLSLTFWGDFVMHYNYALKGLRNLHPFFH